MNKEYTRNQIIKRGMQYQMGWLEVVYSKHAQERLSERLRGNVMIFPKNINISGLNIYKGYSKDGNWMDKVIVRIEFKQDEWMFLVIIPKDRWVKTIWFKKKNEYVKTNRNKEENENSRRIRDG